MEGPGWGESSLLSVLVFDESVVVVVDCVELLEVEGVAGAGTGAGVGSEEGGGTLEGVDTEGRLGTEGVAAGAGARLGVLCLLDSDLSLVLSFSLRDFI